MCSNTQSGGASSIISCLPQRREHQKPQPLETRQLTLDLPHTKSGRIGGDGCENGKVIKNEDTPHLEIQSVPISQRVDPERNSYILVVQPADVRAAGGQYTAQEASEIADRTKGWDFSLEDGKPRCLGMLIRVIEEVCERSAKAKANHSIKVFPKSPPDAGGDPGGGIAESATTEGIGEFEHSGEVRSVFKSFTETASGKPSHSFKTFSNEGGEA